MNSQYSRRTMLKSGGALAGLAALGGASGCGGFAGGSDTIRFSWYGGAERQRAFTEVIRLFEEEHGEATVEPEYADYDPYQDRMATQAAAGDLPDVFWLAGFNILEYEAAGQYRDVEEFVPDIIDLSDMGDDQVENWRINGQLTAIPYAFWNTVVRSNADFLDEVGIEIPDDNTWSWDDLAEICQEYSDAKGDGHWGIGYGAHGDLQFSAWLRQHGQNVFTEDGDVGFDVDTLGDWFAYWERLWESGAAIPVQAQEGVSGSWDILQDSVAFVIGNANHLANDQPTVDYELNVHLCPTIPDPAPGHRFLHYVRFAMFADTENPELAAEFMNFCLNSEAIPELTGQTSGVPTSARLRDIARETADETGMKVIDIIEREAEFDMNPRPEVPPGAGGWRDLMGRAIEAIAIEGTPIAEASAKYIDDLQASIDRAKD